jgi:hypothetical protein
MERDRHGITPICRELIAERVTDSKANAYPVLNRFWRCEPDRRGFLLTITADGVEATSIEAPGACKAPVTEGTNSAIERAAKSAKGRRRRRGSSLRRGRDAGAPTRPLRARQAQLTAMLRRSEGATIAQIVQASGWQPHTTRAAFAVRSEEKARACGDLGETRGGWAGVQSNRPALQEPQPTFGRRLLRSEPEAHRTARLVRSAARRHSRPPRRRHRRAPA